MPQRRAPPRTAGLRAPPAAAAASVSASSRRTPPLRVAGRAACPAASVPYLFRTLLPIPTAFRSTVRVRLTSPAFLPSRRNFEGYIPQSCSGSSLQIYSQSSLLSLSPSSALVVSSQLNSSDVAQRSEEWFALRKDKLTTSTFSTALGFWAGNRRSELWSEKVFGSTEIKLEDAARSAMNWGTVNESVAIEQYTSITGRSVGSLGFAVHTEANFGWLGASPDGVLGCDPDGGILEVKCPFNKGKPELALPWRAMPYYYMPQVQGLMEIMGRDWVELYCWTPNGSSVFRVPRDRGYWELIHEVLRDFWWGNVMPARELVLLGKEAEARSFEPQPKHRLTNLVIFRSRKLASEAKLLCKDIGGHVEFFP
uniref:YqaJ viral recombinase domain-containing protein n=2 Tax=Oryza glaberrima TaxID=4538 RepID=I1QGQ7_ORYGL